MIPLFKIFKPPGIGKIIEEVYDSGFITEGDYSDRFEQLFSQYIGNPNTCLVNSCTSALTLAAHMCGVSPGTEVITTPMTCMATSEPFYNAGAKLVFADIDPLTGNISPDSIESLITDKTVAIVVVHWGGQAADMTRICDIASRRGIKVVEDAAHAVRSYHNDIRIGNHGDYVCFSFQAVKHLSTVDGGAIACKSAEDADRIRRLRWFGLDRNYTAPAGQPPASRWEQDITESGYKMHMNNVNAAIGIENLKYVDELIDAHVRNGLYYDQVISNSPKIGLLRRSEDGGHSYWIYSLLVDDPVKFKAYMSSHGIATDVVHVRNDKYTVFEQFRRELHGVDYFASCVMHIPVGWWLSDREVAYIANVVNEY